jgi:hypothetical protein
MEKAARVKQRAVEPLMNAIIPFNISSDLFHTVACSVSERFKHIETSSVLPYS